MAHSKQPPAAAMAVRRRERRRDERLSVKLRVLMRTDAGEFPLLTENLDRNGLFVRTDAPRPERDLVELVIDTGDDTPLELMCVVRRSITPDEAVDLGMVSGMAVQLYGVTGATRDRWDAFLTALEAHTSNRPESSPPRRAVPRPTSLTATTERGPAMPVPAASLSSPSRELESSPPPTEPQRPLTNPAGPPLFAFEATPTRPRAALPEPARDVTPSPDASPAHSLRPVTPVSGVPRPDTPADGVRRSVAFHIALPTQRKLEAFLGRLLEGRPVSLPSERALPVGQSVHIELVHPQSHENFALPGVVAGNLQKGDGRPRVAVSFDDVPDQWVRHLSEFVRTGVATNVADLEPAD